jgi:hypothetical protein
MEGKKRISSSWRFPDSLARFGLPALLSLSQNLTMSRKSSPDVYLMARWTSVHRKGCLCKRCRPKENPRANDALSQDISLVLDE